MAVFAFVELALCLLFSGSPIILMTYATDKRRSCCMLRSFVYLSRKKFFSTPIYVLKLSTVLNHNHHHHVPEGLGMLPVP